MTKNRIRICVFCVLVASVSCNKQLPQLPSNKGNVVAGETEMMLDINQKLALREDSILEHYIENGDESFVKSELGFWYKIEQISSGLAVKEKDTCKFSCRIMSLNGELLQESIKQIVIGKKNTIVGLEEGLKLMHKGGSATFIIPWYLGFGMAGNGQLVPPYTSLICRVKLYK